MDEKIERYICSVAVGVGDEMFQANSMYTCIMYIDRRQTNMNTRLTYKVRRFIGMEGIVCRTTLGIYAYSHWPKFERIDS